MSNRQRRRREMPLRDANDNMPSVKPPLRYVWSVYRAAARMRWMAHVIASTADEAIEAAVMEFRVDIRKTHRGAAVGGCVIGDHGP